MRYAGLSIVSNSLFGDGHFHLWTYSSLFPGLTNPPEARMVYKCAKTFKPNSANRIQGLEENPSNNVIQIIHIWQHSPDLPIYASHIKPLVLQLVRSPF